MMHASLRPLAISGRSIPSSGKVRAPNVYGRAQTYVRYQTQCQSWRRLSSAAACADFSNANQKAENMNPQFPAALMTAALLAPAAAHSADKITPQNVKEAVVESSVTAKIKTEFAK